MPVPLTATNSIGSNPTSTDSSSKRRSAGGILKSIFGTSINDKNIPFGQRRSASSSRSLNEETQRSSVSLIPQSQISDESSEDDRLNDVFKEGTIDSTDASHSGITSKLIQGYKKPEKWEQPLQQLQNLNLLEGESFDKYLVKPTYVKVFRKAVHTPEIAKRLFLAQELNQNITEEDLEKNPGLSKIEGATSDNPQEKSSIWVMKFNHDGKYLATAGKGNVIKVWKVLSSPLDKISEPTNTINGDHRQKKQLYAPVFQNTTYRYYTGHTHDILSIDWSKNDFLLSSSMDKTVRLWNINQKEFLRIYQHSDFVTSVKFHPTDDRFFISGCLDHKVRLWSILDNEAVYEFNANNLVTAVGFTPNGSLVIVGTFSGVIYCLDTQNLELRHSLDLKKTNKGVISLGGSNSGTSCKVTGIESYQDGDDVKILITSNDSKIRLVSLKDKHLESYFKGPENASSQIVATVSDDKKFIISGSENHWIYLWEIEKVPNHRPPKFNDGPHSNNNSLRGLLSNKKKRRDYITFHSNHSVVTSALIAPIGTSKSLALSNDWIYELNNDLNTELLQNNVESEGLFNRDYIGVIIVSADDTGLIRVFRQDLPSAIRNKLTAEKKKNESFNVNRVSLGKHLNLSNSSLLRSDSVRSIRNRNNSDFARGRSGTMESIRSQTMSTSNTSAINSTPDSSIRCEICGSDKFKVIRSGNGFGSEFDGGNEIGVFCSECGNQIKT